MRHDERRENHETENDSITCHTYLKEKIVDIRISKEMMKEVSVVDSDSSNSDPKCTPHIEQDFISKFLPMLVLISLIIGLTKLLFEQT